MFRKNKNTQMIHPTGKEVLPGFLLAAWRSPKQSPVFNDTAAFFLSQLSFKRKAIFTRRDLQKNKTRTLRLPTGWRRSSRFANTSKLKDGG